MDGIWLLITAAVAFVSVAVIGKFMIPFLKKVNFGQTIREEGPKWHMKKQGTPTMGGIMFIIGIVIACAVSFIGYRYSKDASQETLLIRIRIMAGLLMALAYGFVGFADDYVKVVKKRNLGLTAGQKLFFQFLIAGLYLFCIHLAGQNTKTYIPFVGDVELGFFYYIIAAVFIVGIVNAVNLTDGIDGLCSCVTFFVAAVFMITAYSLFMMSSAIAAAAVAGACLGFLIYNFNPAKVFMGDTGSLFLGGMVCALGFSIDRPILIILLGIIYLMEMFSVMLQVMYFKATHGKRLFKMSPIHHHYEMCGWSEIKICLVFSSITIIGGAAAYILAIMG